MEATQPPGAPIGRSHLWTWTTLAVGAAVMFVYLSLVAPGRKPLGTEGPVIGRRLPYLELQPLTGDSRTISLRDLAGHVTMLNYWGTWCPPCQLEFPHIVKLAGELAAHGDFRLLAVSCGEGRDDDLDELREETQAFLKSRKTQLPTYADQNADSRRAMAITLDLNLGYPTTIVLDRKGIIRGFWEGYTSGSELDIKDLIERLIQEPQAREEKST
jgi:cytochrome c biogenesis protein CcmG, thiol:disulfide interchange protein DsbE